MTELNKESEILPTPDEVEKVMVEKELAQSHPLDNHAAFLTLYFPKLMQGLETLNKKALLRVIELAVKFPIEESDKTLKNDGEKTVFNILNQILTSKYILQIHTAQEEIMKAEKETGTNVETLMETTFNEKEEKNG